MLGAAVTLAANPAWSENIEFSLRGFGTLGASHSDQEKADFTGILFQPNGTGRTHELATTVDSKVGLQLDAILNPQLSVITQVVSQYHYDGSYDPEIEWAYLSYDPTPELSLRAGRIVTAPFMESQTRLVSYTYIWIRPPNELYSLNPITHKTGVDAHYHFTTGDVSNNVGVSWGTAEEEFANGANVKVHSLLELEYRIHMGSSSVRIAYSNIEFDLNSSDLATLAADINAFAADSGENSRLAQNSTRLLQNRSGTYEIYAAGFRYQPDSWLLRGEIALVRTNENTFISEADSWYLTTGRRIGSFTPFITIADISSNRKDAQPLITSNLTSEQAQIANQLNQGLAAAIDSFAFDQRSYSAGLRWDPSPGLAVKLQYSHLKTQSGSGNTGRLVNTSPSFQAGDAANIVSLTMDFVF